MSRPRFEQGHHSAEQWHFHRGEAQRALETKTQLAKSVVDILCPSPKPSNLPPSPSSPIGSAQDILTNKDGQIYLDAQTERQRRQTDRDSQPRGT